MTQSKANIERRLARAQVAITNALADPGLQAALTTYGYTIARLEQGRALRDAAIVLYQQQKDGYGGLFAAADTLDEAQRQAGDTFMRHVKVARVALKQDRGALQKLGLLARRKRGLASWLAQAHQFYANAQSNPDILGKLAAFGITATMLADGQRKIDSVGLSDAARRQRKGAAQDTTRARDEALAELDAWMADFLKIARVALQDRPQLLHQLGLATPGRRGPARTPPSPPAAPTTAAPAGGVEIVAVPAPDSASPTSSAVRRNGHASANRRA